TDAHHGVLIVFAPTIGAPAHLAAEGIVRDDLCACTNAVRHQRYLSGGTHLAAESRIVREQEVGRRDQHDAAIVLRRRATGGHPRPQRDTARDCASAQEAGSIPTTLHARSSPTTTTRAIRRTT